MPCPDTVFNKVSMNALDMEIGNMLILYSNSTPLVTLICRDPKDVVVTGSINCILLIGNVPPGMEGPYETSDCIYNGGSGIWGGYVGSASTGLVIYFDYTPPAAEGEVAVTVKQEWHRIDFKKLSLKQLECAKKELEKARTTFDGDAEKLKIIERIEKEVKDAKDSLPTQE